VADDRPSFSSARTPSSEIAQRAFGVVRRGFDPEEVRAFLEVLARELQTAERREQELLHELTSAEERARHPVIDEGVLTSALGQRSAAVLRNAHDEAARITLSAEEAGASVLREAQQHATDIQVGAESQAAERIAEAELEANALRQQARDESAAMLDAARTEGEALIERARDHGRAMLEQAQDARRRVLADMAHRRRLMTEQIEQFRAARDEIASSIVGVRHAVDRIVDDLARADDAARAAAAEAARHVAIDAPEAVLVAEGEHAAAELGADSGAALAAADDVLTRPGAPHVSLRFDDIATVVAHPPGQVGPVGDVGPVGSVDEVGPVRSVDEVGPVGDATGWPATGAVSDSGTAGVAPPEPGGASSDVEGLFARLRARQSSTATASDDPGPPNGTALATEAAEAAASSAGATAGAARTGAEGMTEGSGGTRGSPTGEAAHAPGAESAVATVAEPPETEPETEPTRERVALDRRAAALDPIVTTMARRLKRALQDDQNGLLDRLRQGPGTWSDDLLPDEATQRALYAKASAGGIRDSMVAGISFARSMIGGRQGRAPSPDQRTLDAVTDELTSTVVTLLRRRLEGGDIPDAAERIGAAYREWRGERIERLAEDRAIEAFGAGALAGITRGGVYWTRGDSGPGCADCEDNALAGTVAPGEEFPTGHRHPPAHAGCRCLVLPAPQ
jgi:DivIVA domain-containing protein